MRFGSLAGTVLVLCLGLVADDYSALFEQAAALSQQGKYGEAIDKYQAALKLRPGAPEALNNLAVMYYEAKRYAEAYETASEAWTRNPAMSSAGLIAGLAAIRIKKPRKAFAPLEGVLAKDPGNRDALLGLASAHIAIGEFSEAAKLYEQRTASDSKDAEAWYGLGICYERLAESASRQLSRMPGGAGYLKRLEGEFLLDNGDTQLAREAFGEAAATGADSAEAAGQYGIARSFAAQARTAFERFVNLAPDSWQAHLFLGDVARQHRDLKAAIQQYEQAARLQPESPAPLLGLGTVYWELADFDRAESFLRQTLGRNPDNLQATFELANIAVRRKQDAAAVPLLEKYLVAEPEALAAHADLGRAYLHLGQFAKAAAELKKAAPIDTHGEIHFELAAALRKLGRVQEADEALKQSAEIREAELKKEEHQHVRQ